MTCVDEAAICDNVPEPARFQKVQLTSHPHHDTRLVTVNVSSLHPHTRYNVSVSAQLAVRDKKTRPGRVTFMSLRTHAGVPIAAPWTCAGCFSLLSSDDARMVTVYWKQIPRHEQNNDIAKYRLRVTGDSGQIHVVDTPDGSATSAVVDSSSLSTNDMLSVTIAGVVILNNTAELLSESATVVVRTSQRNSIPASQLTITVVSSSVETMNEVMWTKVQGAVDYSVVWCRRLTDSTENNMCKGDISWRHVTTTSSALLPISNLDLVDIMIGVSANMGTHHTGIIWSECSQFDSQEKPVVQVLDTELPVKLRILPAQCKQNSREYTVEYCSADVGNSHCTELHIGRWTGVVLKLPYVEVELHGIRPGQNYTIVVYSNSSPFRPSAAFVAQVELLADGYGITISHGTIALVLAVVLLLVLLSTIFVVLHQSALTAECVRYLKRGCLEDIAPPSPPRPTVIANDQIDTFETAEAGFLDYEDNVLRISVKDAACQILLPDNRAAQSTESTERSHLLPPEADNDADSIHSSSSSGEQATVGYCCKTGYAGERQDATSNDTSVTSSLNANTQRNIITDIAAPLQYEDTIQALPANSHINSLTTTASLTASEQQVTEEAANGVDDNYGDDDEEQSSSQSSLSSGFMVAYARPAWAVNSGDGSRSRSASSRQHDEESQSVSSVNALASDHSMTDNYAAMAWVGGSDMPPNASIDDEGSDEELTCPYATAVSAGPTDGYAFLTRLHSNASEDDDDDQFNEEEPAYATAGRFVCLNNVSQNIDMPTSLDNVSNVAHGGQLETDATNGVVQRIGSRDDSSVSVVQLCGTNTNESDVDLTVQCCSSPSQMDSNGDLSLPCTSARTRESDEKVCDSVTEMADDMEQYSDSGGSFCAYAHAVH